MTVKLVDKSMPVFDKQFYSVSTPEDVALHSPLPVTIKAESPLGRKLIYSIVAGDPFEEFAVDFSTGRPINSFMKLILIFSTESVN